MRFRSQLVLVGLMLIICAAPSRGEETGWRLRLYGFYMSTGDEPVVVDEAGTTLSTDNGYGAGIGLAGEYRLNPRLGLELGVATADQGDYRPDAILPGAVVDATDTISVTTLSGALNLHLTPGAQADVYVGAVLSWVDYDGFEIHYSAAGQQPVGSPSTVRVDVGTDIGIGLQIGLDLALDEEHWIFHAGLRYLTTSIDGNGTGAALQSVDFDPLLFGLGFGYRF